MDRVFVGHEFIRPRLSGYSVSLHTVSLSCVAGAVLGTLYMLVPEVFTNALGKYASPLFSFVR